MRLMSTPEFSVIKMDKPDTHKADKPATQTAGKTHFGKRFQISDLDAHLPRRYYYFIFVYVKQIHEGCTSAD